jgi:hypothetical protein
VRSDAEDFGSADADGGEADRRARATPRWFLPSYKTATPDDIAEHYRSRRVELLPPRASHDIVRPLRMARAGFRHAYGEPDDPHDWPAMRHERPATRSLRRRRPDDDAAHDFDDERRSPRRSSEFEVPGRSSAGVWLYVLAGTTAMLAGGLLGYGVSHYRTGLGQTELATAPPPPPAAAPIAAAAVATGKTAASARKPVATAALDVADAAGERNAMIPLALSVAAAGGQDLVLKLTGLPPSAYLTAGRRAAADAWQVDAHELAGLKLVVTEISRPKFDLAVAAYEAKSGELAAPVKELTVAIADPVQIEPAAAVPEVAVVKPAAPKLAEEAAPLAFPKPPPAAAGPSQEAMNLMTKGDILLKSGDMAMARQFYERAFAEGATAAAIGAGKTYDPVVYGELNVQGLKPDPARALEWYERASAAGHRDVEAAIAALKEAAP